MFLRSKTYSSGHRSHFKNKLELELFVNFKAQIKIILNFQNNSTRKYYNMNFIFFEKVLNFFDKTEILIHSMELSQCIF